MVNNKSSNSIWILVIVGIILYYFSQSTTTPSGGSPACKTCISSQSIVGDVNFDNSVSMSGQTPSQPIQINFPTFDFSGLTNLINPPKKTEQPVEPNCAVSNGVCKSFGVTYNDYCDNQNAIVNYYCSAKDLCERKITLCFEQQVNTYCRSGAGIPYCG